MTELVKYSRDQKTAWANAYNVHLPAGAGYPMKHLGLVYRDSDDRWHAIATDGSREGGWQRRSDAAYYLTSAEAQS